VSGFLKRYGGVGGRVMAGYQCNWWVGALFSRAGQGRAERGPWAEANEGGLLVDTPFL